MPMLYAKEKNPGLKCYILHGSIRWKYFSGWGWEQELTTKEICEVMVLYYIYILILLVICQHL
jgi:hypothetical protein